MTPWIKPPPIEQPLTWEFAEITGYDLEVAGGPYAVAVYGPERSTHDYGSLNLQPNDPDQWRALAAALVRMADDYEESPE